MSVTKHILPLVAFICLISCSPSEKKAYIPFAMSHNDYEQEVPLQEAFSYGFACVEADVHLKDGELFVAHTTKEIEAGKTLRSMYLNPIREMVKKGGINKNRPLILYVDQKTKGETFTVLCQQLEEYKEMLARYDLDGYHPGVVKVVSGKWPMMKQLETRYTFAESKYKDIDSPLPSSAVLLVNDRWGDYFSWRGEGVLPVKEELKLRKMARQAEQDGRILRFWETDFESTEAREKLWSKLLECGVDMIGTDYLSELSDFAKNNSYFSNGGQTNGCDLQVENENESINITSSGTMRLFNGRRLDHYEDIEVKSTSVANNISILKMDFSGKKDTVRFAFDSIIDLKEGVAAYLFGDWESWTKPINFKKTELLPDEKIMFVLWRHIDGTYGTMIPLCGNQWVTHLAGGEKGIGSVSVNWKNEQAENVPFMAVGFGENPYQLIKDVYKEGMKAINRDNNLREYKPYPAMFEDLGWCTWNAMYEDVSEQKIVDGINTFKELGIRIPWLLIDDGWLCIDDEKRLTSMGFDSEKFPEGISGVIDNLKENHGLKHVGVWHTMNGYWSGIDAKKFKSQQDLIAPYRDKAGVHDLCWSDRMYYAPSPDLSDNHNFYDVWYKQLQGEGISFVKVDQQSVIKRMANGIQGDNTPGYWQLATGMERNLQRSIQKYFNGQVVNCQDMAIEALYNMAGSAVIRNSDDFFPERTAYFSLEVEKGNAAAHAIMNIHNALWISQMGWPDYDMFQTHHVNADYHAALRAISGGPVYITDTPGLQNSALIKKLINKEGKLYRADIPALPTEDCLFNINKKQPLKAFSRIGESGVLAIFNTDDAEQVVGSWTPSDITGLQGKQFAAYKHGTEKVELIEDNAVIPVNLKRLAFEYWNVVPLKDRYAVIGVLNKFNSRSTVLSEVINVNKISATIAEGGEIGIVLPVRPKDIWVNGKVFTGNIKYGENLLVIEYDSKEEVLIEVFF